MRNSILDNVVAFTGRQNSGKTTLVEQLVSALGSRGLVVSSLKHHGHPGFQIDVEGKDSYRHHAAGTLATAILSPDRFALVEETRRDDCAQAAGLLPCSNVVLVEGFRHAGFPTVELVRAANPKDAAFAPQLIARLEGAANAAPEPEPRPADAQPLPAAVVTDLPAVDAAARAAGIPAFGFQEADELADWIEARFSKPLYSIAIQAGGESRRMGTSKALVPFFGQPLIQHVAARMAPGAADLVVTTNQPDDLRFLEGLHPGVRLVRDTHDERGALPGLITALENARYPLVGVVACDMVEAPAALLRHEAHLLAANPHVDAVVPVTGFGFEPFCAVYRREPCLAAARAAYAAGSKRLRDVLSAVERLELDAKADPHVPPGCFRNVNTPDELAQAADERPQP